MSSIDTLIPNVLVIKEKDTNIANIQEKLRKRRQELRKVLSESSLKYVKQSARRRRNSALQLHETMKKICSRTTSRKRHKKLHNISSKHSFQRKLKLGHQKYSTPLFKIDEEISDESQGSISENFANLNHIEKQNHAIVKHIQNSNDDKTVTLKDNDHFAQLDLIEIKHNERVSLTNAGEFNVDHSSSNISVMGYACNQLHQHKNKFTVTDGLFCSYQISNTQYHVQKFKVKMRMPTKQHKNLKKKRRYQARFIKLQNGYTISCSPIAIEKIKNYKEEIYQHLNPFNMVLRSQMTTTVCSGLLQMLNFPLIYSPSFLLTGWHNSPPQTYKEMETELKSVRKDIEHLGSSTPKHKSESIPSNNTRQIPFREKLPLMFGVSMLVVPLTVAGYIFRERFNRRKGNNIQACPH